MYAIIQTKQFYKWLLQPTGDLSADLVHGESTPPVAGGKNPFQWDLYQADTQRSTEMGRETWIHRNKSRLHIFTS